MHCIKVSEAKALIFDDDLFEAVGGIRSDLAALPYPMITASFGAPIPPAHRGQVGTWLLWMWSMSASRFPASACLLCVGFGLERCGGDAVH